MAISFVLNTFQNNLQASNKYLFALYLFYFYALFPICSYKKSMGIGAFKHLVIAL